MKPKFVSRNRDIETIFEIIDNREIYRENSENGLVILLNGSWGSGKTTFLKELEEKIGDNPDLDLFVNYNSFEYDFYDNAYLPLFASIEDKIKLGKNFGKLIRGTGMMFVSTIYAITNGYLKNKTGIDIELNDIKDNFLLFKDEMYLKNYNDFKECKIKIKEKLKRYCEKRTKVFIVDELDRCKPSFAMETLEIIKHFFDIENCVFIISVDKLQLQESAKTIYGQNMDIEKYFSKFFDYQYNLLPINFNEIVDIGDNSDLREIVDRSTTIFKYLKVSSRDSKKIFSDYICKYNKFCTDEYRWTGDQSLFVIFLLTLKYVDLLFYKEIIDGNYSRIKRKITDDLNPSSNNYTKLLDINIGYNKNFDYVLNKLTNSLDYKYIGEYEMNTTSFNENSYFKLSKEATGILNVYIPYIGYNLSFKETITSIIN